MKKIQYIPIFAVMAIFVFSCKPNEDKLPALIPNTGTALVEQLHPHAAADNENPNSIIFTMDSKEGVVGVWNINGKYYPQNVLIRNYEFAGDYQVEAFAYNQNGTCQPVTVQFNVTQNDDAVCANEDYTNLTGGCEAPNGKTWILYDWSYGGTDGDASWDNKFTGDNNLNDEMTFVLNANKTYSHDTKGSVDYEWTATDCPAYTASWELYESKGKKYLNFTNSGFLPPHATIAANNNEYIVLELSENMLRVKLMRDDTDANAFYYRYIPKP